MNFIDKKISIKKSIAILAKNGIHVDDGEAVAILDFLYLMAKNYRKPGEEKDGKTLMRNRTLGKMP